MEVVLHGDVIGSVDQNYIAPSTGRRACLEAFHRRIIGRDQESPRCSNDNDIAFLGRSNGDRLVHVHGLGVGARTHKNRVIRRRGSNAPVDRGRVGWARLLIAVLFGGEAILVNQDGCRLHRG
jgi:hypothetical protein